MQESKPNVGKRKNPFIRIAVLLIPILALLLSQTVFAQNTYVITDGDRVLVYTSSNTDPVLVLDEAGLALGADDTYTAQTGIGVSEITVQRSQTVVINNGGDVIEASTNGETVGALVQRLGISLGGNATVSVPLEMQTRDGLEIDISRSMQEEQTYTTNIPYEVTYCNDYTLPVGATKVVTPGVSGEMLCTANVIYVDGVETDRVVLTEKVVSQPVNEVIAVGCAVDAIPSESPLDHVKIEDGLITLPTGEVLSYTGTMQVLATAYSHLDPGCGFITATGTTVHVGSVAVDPRVIPFGTRMFIVTNDGSYVYGICTAEDSGSSIKQERVDLYFPTRELCKQFGMRNATIYFLG